MNDDAPRHLIVFGKPPIAGRVKTRLARTTGPERAALLYSAFLEDTLSRLDRAADERTIWWQTDRPALPERAGWSSRRQSGADLGDRLDRATRAAFAGGAARVVAIGSDSPTLPGQRIEQAFEILGTDRDAVFGPTPDGGYYLIGLARPSSEVFAGIQWSTARVLAQSLERAEAAGLRVALLEPWFDVDTADDLARLAIDLERDPAAAPATAALICRSDA